MSIDCHMIHDLALSLKKMMSEQQLWLGSVFSVLEKNRNICEESEIR
jgi:hypothetical protein